MEALAYVHTCVLIYHYRYYFHTWNTPLFLSHSFVFSPARYLLECTLIAMVHHGTVVQLLPAGPLQSNHDPSSSYVYGIDLQLPTVLYVKYYAPFGSKHLLFMYIVPSCTRAYY